MIDLRPFEKDLAPIPERIRQAIERGVRAGAFPFSEIPRLFEERQRELEDGVFRNPDGTLTVLAQTELPGVTPSMLHWWMGWHIVSSPRYRLWHPGAHLKAWAKEDRQELEDDRQKYRDNTSYVDETIGGKVQKLAIELKAPGAFGFTRDAVLCANLRVRSPLLSVEFGRLVHFLEETAGGSIMRSGFWLGALQIRPGLLGYVPEALLNRPLGRRLLFGDRLGLALLRHCAEEMNHLPRFLPGLYRAVFAAERG